MSVKQEIPTLIKEQTDRIPEDKRTSCEIWTRVMGYYRPTSQFNIGKKQEAKERVPFKEPKLKQK